MRRAIIGGLVALSLAFAGCKDDQASGGGGQAGGTNPQSGQTEQTPASQNSYGTPGITPTPDRSEGPRGQATGGSGEEGAESEQASPQGEPNSEQGTQQ